MISDKYNVREKNESMILKAIIDNSSISRADLAKNTNLNKASVSSITKSLIEKNLVIETGTGDASSAGGRKPVLLEFYPYNGALLSIDVGTNYIRGIMTYLDGKEISWYEQENITISKMNVINIIHQVINKLIYNKTIEIKGLTVGVHGVVKDNNIRFTPYYDLTNFNLFEQLSQTFPFPIYIENEANLVALSAYCFGLKAENLIALSVHSGIGAGIVVDGILQKGIHGEAGEIGHSILYPNGIDCPCGNKGCFEQYASTIVLFDHINKDNSINVNSMEQLTQEYSNGNIKIIDYLHENAFLMSIGINNLSNILNPETIVINSSVYNKIPELVDVIKDNLDGQFSKNIKLQTSELQEKSIVMGGIALASQHYLRINKLKFYLR